MRAAGCVYSLKPEHVALLHELDRLFPERAPIVDFASIPVGAESVELVALRLHSALLSHVEQPVFVAFCHVNAERMLDLIRATIERGAYPLSPDAVLADVYVRYFELLRDQQDAMRAGKAVPLDSRNLTNIGSIFELLGSLATTLVSEQVEFIASCELPLPGLKLPPLEPGDETMRRADGDLRALGCSVSSETARHWVAHALLRLPPELRRVLHLREHQRLSLSEIGHRLSIDPFDVGLRLKRAWLELREQLIRTIVAFRAGAPPPEIVHPAGRLLRLPRRDGTRVRPSDVEEEA